MKALWRLLALPLLLAAPLLAGCGSDSDDDDATLSGVAATGVALVGTVTVVDASGVQSEVETRADGSFVITVDDNPPFMLSATDGTTVLYSWSGGGGTVNITPLTGVALVTAVSTDLESLFDGWADDHSQITQVEIDEAMAVVNANLESYYTENGVDFTTFDFFGEEFEADGSGIDGVLDDVDVDLQGTVVILTDDGTSDPIDFDIHIDIDGIDIGGDTSDGDGGGGTVGNIPADSVWRLTITDNVSGQTTVEDNIPGNEVPASQADFEEVAEGDIGGDFSFGDTTISFDFVDVSLTSDVNGVVGDTVTGHTEGTISITGIPDLPDITDQAVDVDFQWERTS